MPRRAVAVPPQVVAFPSGAGRNQFPRRRSELPESLVRRLRKLDAEQLQIVEIMVACLIRGAR